MDATAVRTAGDSYNREGARKLLEGLAAGPLLAQGPMGSLFLSEPAAEGVPAAAWNLSEPQTVERFHSLYGLAGAQVMITNTFQASEPALERDHVLQGVSQVNRSAVDCARKAGARMLLGSMGPCGVSWMLEDTPEYRRARAAYREQARALLEAGVDGLLLETFTGIRDLTPALAGVGDVADGMPVLVSFATNDGGDLLQDGLNIEAAGMFAEERGAAAVGINCCSVASSAATLRRLRRALPSTPLMVRPSAGKPYRGEDGAMLWHEKPEVFAAALDSWIEAGARLVGGCCGTTPRTVLALAEKLGI